MIDAKDFTNAADALQRAGFERQAGVTAAWALRRSGNVVRRHVRARAKAHRRTGRLSQNVSVKAKGAGLGIEVRIHAGGRVAHLIIGGTKPHEIRPLRAHAIAMHASGRAGALRGFAAVVHHPGTRADPFFHAGVDDSSDEIQTIVTEAAATMARELAYRMSRRR